MFCPKCGTQNVQTVRFCRNCGADLGNVSEALSGNLRQPPTMLDKKGKPVNWESAIVQIFTGMAFLIVAAILGITGIAGGKFWWFWMLIPAFGSLGSGVARYVQLKKSENHNASFAPSAQNALDSNFSNASLPPPSANQYEVQNLINQGRKIEAIKVFRETYNVGLKEAKEAVEAMQAGQMPQMSQPINYNQSTPDKLEEVRRLAVSGRKIEAIKEYREIYDVGLKEAKDAVEAIERGQMPLNMPRNYNEPPPRGSAYDTGELTPPPSVTENTTRHLEMDSEGETMNLPKGNL